MVEYEGRQIERDGKGKYRCPHRCGDPNYPQPSWVSDKGFLGHLAKCAGRVELRHDSEPVKEREKFADCPDCGGTIWKMSSCWWMHDKIVCLACYRPYFDQGIGHHDAAGLDLPLFSLEV